MSTNPASSIDQLRLRRVQADTYAKGRDMDMWGARVAWFVLSEGVATGRTMCARYNKKSPAWRCYQNLVKAGLVVEGPGGGLKYTPALQWEEGEGPLRWYEELAKVAAGQPKHPLL